MITLFDTLHSQLDYRSSGQLGSAEERYRQKTVFLLCGLYCLVAIVFLCVFGVEALQAGNDGYGHVLLGFAGMTAACYALIWLSGRYVLANHLATLLMGLLCLYLLYTGGVANTGPLWYFVFPLLAMFLQGTRVGTATVVLLFFCSCIVVLMQWQGFAPTAYSAEFLERLAAVYVAVSALGYLFAYFRDESEQRMKESNRQLAALSGYDTLTGLVSRRRAEIVLEVEARKHFRYQSSFSLILVRIDGLEQLKASHGEDFAAFIVQEVGALLKKDVRFVDLLCRWDDDMFGVLLPMTSLSGAIQQAERIRLRMTTQHFKLDGMHARLTVSAGVGEFKGSHIGRFMHEVREQLAFAVSTGGNCVMFADTTPVRAVASN
jgi:diguanylate cyclase (GGDEF)-like protein